MSDLLPCPFCGGEAEGPLEYGVNISDDVYPLFEIECKECSGRNAAVEKDLAIAAWNRRRDIDEVKRRMDVYKMEYELHIDTLGDSNPGGSFKLEAMRDLLRWLEGNGPRGGEHDE